MEKTFGISLSDVMLPPPMKKKLKGRPQRLRRKEEWEAGATKIGEVGRVSRKGRKMHCTLCKGEGHNRLSCPKHPTLPGNWLHNHGLNSPRRKRRVENPSNPSREDAPGIEIAKRPDNVGETSKGKDKDTFTSATTVEGCTPPASTPPTHESTRKRQTNTRGSQSSTSRPFKTPRQKGASNTKQ